jgi:DNA-binding MarR family transcriptional regulator
MAASECPLTQKTVADILGINPNVMVEIVLKLEQDGMLRKAKNPIDRREYILEVTDKGKEFLKRWYAEFDEIAEDIFHPIPLKDVERFRKLALNLIREYCDDRDVVI